jgi:hypothetical protein
MAAKGRKSGAALSIAASSVVTAIQRARPPGDLSPEAAAEWRAIVNRLPAEWFPVETHPLLASYCRHIITSRRVAELIADCESRDDFDVSEYERLLRMQDRESRALAALGRGMRLTQQSTYAKTKSKPSRASKAPWEVEDEG